MAEPDPIRTAINSLSTIVGIAFIDDRDDPDEASRDKLLAKLDEIYDRAGAMAAWLQDQR